MNYKKKYEYLVNKDKKRLLRLLDLSNYMYVIGILFILLSIAMSNIMVFEAGMFYGGGCLIIGNTFGMKLTTKKKLRKYSCDSGCPEC